MRLSIRHRTLCTYRPEAARVALRLKLYPADHAGQRLIDWRVTVNGVEVPMLLRDPCGDGIGLWQKAGSLEEVEVLACGTVETADLAGVVRDLPTRPPEAVFLRETRATGITPRLQEFAARITETGPLARMHALSEAVAEAIAYRPRVTEARTTASQALELGAGVCQDHAHVFIAAARALGTPARYVVGYLKAGAEGEDLETHAWAEAAVPGLGWVGFDPSNAVCPTADYVRLGCGFDALDAAPVTGNLGGASVASVAAAVSVSEAGAGPSQSQSQEQ